MNKLRRPVLWLLCLALLGAMAATAPAMNLPTPVELSVTIARETPSGSNKVLPGEYFEFKVADVQIKGAADSVQFVAKDYIYYWEIASEVAGVMTNPDLEKAFRLEPCGLFGERVRVYVLDNEYAWLLFNAVVTCDVVKVDARLLSDQESPLIKEELKEELKKKLKTADFAAADALSAEDPWFYAGNGTSDAMLIGIKATPVAEGLQPQVLIPRAATISPLSVHGGNAPADELSYRWQRYNGTNWVNNFQTAEIGTDRTVTLADAGTDVDFRCLIGLAGDTPTNNKFEAAAGYFRVTAAYKGVGVDKNVKLYKYNSWTDIIPAPYYVMKGSSNPLEVTITTPMNKTNASATTHTVRLYRYTGTALFPAGGPADALPDSALWTEVSVAISKSGEAFAGDTIRTYDVTFSTAGRQVYMASVTSDASKNGNKTDYTAPFVVTVLEPLAEGDVAWSASPEDLYIRFGKTIAYFAESANPFVTANFYDSRSWYESSTPSPQDLPFASGKTAVNFGRNVHGGRVLGEAFLVNPTTGDGMGEPLYHIFDGAYVDLIWETEPPVDKVIRHDQLGTKGFDLKARGGSGYYGYFYWIEGFEDKDDPTNWECAGVGNEGITFIPNSTMRGLESLATDAEVTLTFRAVDFGDNPEENPRTTLDMDTVVTVDPGLRLALDGKALAKNGVGLRLPNPEDPDELDYDYVLEFWVGNAPKVTVEYNGALPGETIRTELLKWQDDTAAPKVVYKGDLSAIKNQVKNYMSKLPEGQHKFHINLDLTYENIDKWEPAFLRLLVIAKTPTVLMEGENGVSFWRQQQIVTQIPKLKTANLKFDITGGSGVYLYSIKAPGKDTWIELGSTATWQLGAEYTQRDSVVTVEWMVVDKTFPDIEPLTGKAKLTIGEGEPDPDAVTGLALTGLTLTVGGKGTPVPTFTPEGTVDDLTWSTTDTTLIEVNASTGEVTALAEGTATVKATCVKYGVSATCTVVVRTSSISLTGITLTPTTLNAVVGDDPVTLTVGYVPQDTTDDKTVTWGSSNESVATVSNGVVTFQGAGSATITATVGSFSETCLVTVTDQSSGNFELLGISEGPGSYTKNSTFASIVDHTGTLLPGMLTWKCSSPSYATVDASGVVTVKTALTVTVKITATPSVGTAKEYKITLNPKL